MSNTLGGLSGLRAAAPPPCPICMDSVQIPSSTPDADAVTLSCGHTLCRGCVGPYVAIKVREHQVQRDQLVCPVVECRRGLRDRDLRGILTADGAYDQYKDTLQRVRDEHNPRARWCPRAECSELIVCKSSRAKTFTCPMCATVGCFSCRGVAHACGQRCHASRLTSAADDEDDALYWQWEQSLATADAAANPVDTRPVRACPKCQMRIWKSDGCNHMTCTHCRHEYCWACDATWHRRHYACGMAAATPPRRHRPVGRMHYRPHGILASAQFFAFVLLFVGFEIVAGLGRALQLAGTNEGHDGPATRHVVPQRPLPQSRRWTQHVWHAINLTLALLVFIGANVLEILRTLYNRTVRPVWASIPPTWPRVRAMQ